MSGNTYDGVELRLHDTLLLELLTRQRGGIKRSGIVRLKYKLSYGCYVPVFALEFLSTPTRPTLLAK